jgi:hypothetical protein
MSEVKKTDVYENEWNGMTQERFDELYENPDMWADAADEIMAELVRMRNILYMMRQAHYAMLDWVISEGQGDRDTEEYQNYLDHLNNNGLATTEKNR